MTLHPPPHFRYGLSPENKLKEEMPREEKELQEAEREESKRNPRDFALYTREPVTKPTDISKDPRDFTRYT